MGFFGAFLLGLGLAIDAGCVCTATGLVYRPRLLKSLVIALPFAVLQGVMPIVGYVCISLLPEQLFKYNHVIAFILLGGVGFQMIFATRQSGTEQTALRCLTVGLVLLQAVSTGIDALSVGISFVTMPPLYVVISAIIISLTTYIMCLAAIIAGKNIGTKLNSRAEVFGGVVLVLVGLRMLFLP